MLKLFAFEGAETDWVAADNEADARRALIHHYGITEEDVDGSYTDVSEVDPATVEFYLDVTPVDDEEETPTETAAEMMKGKTKPFLVGSTCQ